MGQVDCVFCRIAAGQIPSAKVYEDDATLAFLDIGPLADGHLLLIPKKHYAWITDMPADEAAVVASKIPRLARAVVEATGAPGFNVLQNNGQVSGQAVTHVHFHIIPRHEGDGLGYRWFPKHYPEGKAQNLLEAIRQRLQGG